ncbi:MAG: hypothetical protein E6Y52_10970 [Enterobacter hormaechei]|nr:hypothetical protein [Enterobacter hormaechei]
MSTITNKFTKEQLQQIEAAAKEVMWPVVWSEKKAREHFSEKITPKVVLKLARIALASLEAEPVAWLLSGGGAKNNVSFDSGNAYADPLREVTPLYTAPPAPVSVPDEVISAIENLKRTLVNCNRYNYCSDAVKRIENACRAAMLQGAERTNYRAIVERIAEIIHGKVTDIDLLTVTVKSMKDNVFLPLMTSISLLVIAAPPFSAKR